MREPKQERAVRTRAIILRAAAEVFDELGFSGANIREITHRAGITQGAMYFHFKSKEDLARALMKAQPSTVLPHTATSGLQGLVDLTLVWSHQLRQDVLLRAGVRLTGEQNSFGVHDATPYREWAEVLAERLREARAQGELADHVDIGSMADFVVSACTGMQMYSQVATGRQDLSERVVAMWQHLLPALCTGEARASIDASASRAEALTHSGVPVGERIAPSVLASRGR
ncbi:ScbR family autoregulator-binding transcription factor [Streptomyces sp. NPDC006997]|uniref:ScbR family autoregulator-binding transcription factor n=1 Tax=Streptomyces sp. NPDC006997 TaxID=3155356 RepID=UPI0034098785